MTATEEWCQPMDCGKHKPRHFIVRFEESGMGDAVFTDEAEAYEYFAKANVGYNCWLFGAMPLPNPPTDVPAISRLSWEGLEELRKALGVWALAEKGRCDTISVYIARLADERRRGRFPPSIAFEYEAIRDAEQAEKAALQAMRKLLAANDYALLAALPASPTPAPLQEAKAVEVEAYKQGIESAAQLITSMAEALEHETKPEHDTWEGQQHRHKVTAWRDLSIEFYKIARPLLRKGPETPLSTPTTSVDQVEALRAALEKSFYAMRHVLGMLKTNPAIQSREYIWQGIELNEAIDAAQNALALTPKSGG